MNERSQVVFDLETWSADALYRRPDFMRLGGFIKDGKGTLTTSGDEIAAQVASGTPTGHNVCGFDLPVLARWHGLDLTALRGHVVDTYLLGLVNDPPPSGHKGGVSRKERPAGYYGLDKTCLRYGLPHKTDDLKAMAKQYAATAKKEGRGKVDGYGEIPTDDPEFRGYLEGDLIASRALAAKMTPLTPYAEREMVIGLATSQMQVNGFRVDVPEIRRALDEQDVRRRTNIQTLHDLTGMPLRGVNPVRSGDGNQAIERALIDAGIPSKNLPRTGKSGTLCTGREELTEFLDRVKKFAGNRDVSKIQKIIELVVAVSSERTVYQTAEGSRVDDRVHPKVSPSQASGRWSVTNPGLTVYGKRNGRHVERRIFLPEEGHVLVAFDQAQADSRAVAAHSGDEGYLRIFREGLDIHGELAEQLFGDRKKREQVKPIGHGWNYGRGVRAISEAEDIPLSVVSEFDRGMRSKYAQVVGWQQHVREISTAGKLLDNGFGRKLRSEPQFAFTQAPALVGQGTTRDIMGEWIVRLPTEFWKFLRTIVHDELVFSLPIADVEEMSRIIVAAGSFDLADATNGRLSSCPVLADESKQGLNWAMCYEK